jgi:hypothetical protein
MTANRNTPEHGPTPEQLQAYADGELDQRTHASVEAWLDLRPDAQAEVEAMRRIVTLYRDSPPAEPCPGAWEDTLGHIKAALPMPGPSGKPPASRVGSRWGVRLLLGLAACAAVLGGVLLARPLWFAPPVEPAVVHGGDGEEPFPVATAQDINVIRVDARDADSLVLSPPVMGSFDVAEPEEIELLAVGPDPARGRRVRMTNGSVAMIEAVEGSEEP